MEFTNVIEMVGITKAFGSNYANKNVNLDVRKGEILSILGENGSGKTTLMNMLAGIYFPDEGKIFVNGQEAIIRSPLDAFNYGIGMIHQHFKLVELFTACDNIILGEKHSFDFKGAVEKIKAENDGTDKGKFLTVLKYMALPFVAGFDKAKFNLLGRKRAKKLQAEVDKYGFQLDLSRKIYDLSVSEKQTVEIIKVLYRGAEILILDEPTAVLTPQEIEKLFDVLRKMREDGKSIIIITHKLNEVMAISDRVAILRKGEHIATVNTAETTERELTEMMVGSKVELNINRSEPGRPIPRLMVEGLTLKNMEGYYALKDVTFTARAGEIFGIAGIAGSGQRELLETIAGLYRPEHGDIYYVDPDDDDNEIDLKKKTPAQIRELGVRLSFVPEDRLGMGLVGNMDLTDNVMLRSYGKGHSLFLDRKSPKKVAQNIVDELSVATPSIKTPVRRLSGGNIQKVLVGREIASAPTVFMAAYPVRGLDIGASYTIYNLLNAQKEQGVSVIFVGEDLDVLLALCDRIMVFCDGQVSGIVDARTASKEEIGYMMTSLGGVDKSQNQEKGDENND